MGAIFRHLRKFIPWILMMVGFIVIQTMSELELPQYTSAIVNVGIQQGGIEETLPDTLRASEAQKLMLLADDETAALIAASYEEQGELLVLRELDESARGELEDALLKPMTMLYYLSQESELTEQIKAQLPVKPEGNLSNALTQLAPEQLAALLPYLQQGMKQLDVLDEAVLRQSAIGYIQQEYAACGKDMDKIRLDYMLKTGGTMLLISLIITVAAICANFAGSRLGAGFAREMRSSVFERVMHFSQKEFSELSTATLITRSTNDIQQIQMLITMGLRMLFFAPLMGFGSLVKVIGMNADMSWVVAFAVAAVLLLMATLFVATMPKFRIMQKLIDRINLVAREALAGLPVVRAFSREDYENERFDGANNDLTKTSLFVNRVLSLQPAAMSLIMNGVCILIIWVGADLVDAGSAQVGDLLAFVQYAMHIVISFMFLSMISIQLPRALVSFRRVSEILNMPVSIQNPENPQHFADNSRGVVEFRNVCFRYSNAEADVLHDISFTALPGQTTAFIGSTGSGKSTLVNLVPRFFDVTEGEILIDGRDIREVSLHELRERIGFIPQKGQLFTGTIASNICYGTEETDEERMRLAARIAQAEDFIEESPDGYDREISQGGTNVSGGQRQRLSIARAIAKDPDIYVFDDSFSALDFKTDSALRKALAEHTGDATVLIVAQRISTILYAEQIIVLDQGRIVGRGTHEELMRDCLVYRQIAESQLSREELGE